MHRTVHRICTHVASCMYECMYVCKYVHACIHTNTHTLYFACACVPLCSLSTYVHTYVCTHTYAQVHPPSLPPHSTIPPFSLLSPFFLLCPSLHSRSFCPSVQQWEGGEDDRRTHWSRACCAVEPRWHRTCHRYIRVTQSHTQSLARMRDCVCLAYTHA